MIREDFKAIKEELDEIFAEYQNSVNGPLDDTLEEGMKRMLIWNEERKRLMNGSSS